MSAANIAAAREKAYLAQQQKAAEDAAARRANADQVCVLECVCGGGSMCVYQGGSAENARRSGGSLASCAWWALQKVQEAFADRGCVGRT